MHKLERDPVPPLGLGRYRHGQDQWGGTPLIPSLEERDEIWQKLNAMQGKRCAYCEGPLPERDKHKCHIEHFRQRDRYPQGTFDWHNLFGSCNRPDSCGSHKDNKYGAYSHEVLIKPDVENPEKFLLFTKDGAVHARKDLLPKDLLRAEETIRILNLNGPLKAIRSAAVQPYVETAEGLAALAADPACSEEDLLFFLQNELKDTAHLPYATAIRHVLTPQY
jgi:uncharacterized protein (TIGR02646 family)